MMGPVLNDRTTAVVLELAGAWNTITARVNYVFVLIVSTKCPIALFPQFECTDIAFKLSSKFSSLIDLYVGTPKILGMSLCRNPTKILLIVLIFLLFFLKKY